MNDKPQYMNFLFLRLDPAYHQLMMNEKVVAKQEFMACFDSFQSKMPLASYVMTGLRADCDVLLWRVNQSLDELYHMACRLQDSGIGRFLYPVYSFLGTVSGAQYASSPQVYGKPSSPSPIGNSPYLFVRPLSAKAAARLARTPRLHVADCAGLDDQECVLAFETSDLAEYRTLLSDVEPAHGAPEGSGPPNFACLLREMRDIVDSLG
jgi:chlorite dismutase